MEQSPSLLDLAFKDYQKTGIKVALCLSGQPRFYNTLSGQSLFKYILNLYDTDVFIHSWVSDTGNYPSAPWSHVKDCTIPCTVRNDLENMYHPKKSLYEEPKQVINIKSSDNNSYTLKNCPSMFYSLSMCDKLRQEYERDTGIIYDWVVRARTDTLLQSFPVLSKLDKNTLYVPATCPNPLVCNDNFAVCPGNLASIVFSVFDTVAKMYADESTRNDIIIKLSTSPEDVWMHHLFLNNISVKRCNIHQSFIRGWDDVADPFRTYIGENTAVVELHILEK